MRTASRRTNLYAARSCGKDEADEGQRRRKLGVFDTVFEFATPLSVSGDADTLDPDFDSGDGVHPNGDGYRVIAEAVDISVLSGSPAS